MHSVVANRLGRVSEIAKKFNELRKYIAQFFYACVDANGNKLVLEASVDLRVRVVSQFFRDLRGTRRFSNISTKAVALIEIDETIKTSRSWRDVKDFFNQKTPELKERMKECQCTRNSLKQ